MVRSDPHRDAGDTIGSPMDVAGAVLCYALA